MQKTWLMSFLRVLKKHEKLQQKEHGKVLNTMYMAQLSCLFWAYVFAHVWKHSIIISILMMTYKVNNH